MKALYTTSPGQYGLAERPVPEPAYGEALLKVSRAGFCVNDLRIREGTLTTVRYPVIPGHQYAGVVEACGPEVKYVATGDRVAVHAYVLCGECSSCRRGGVHDCERFRNLGFSLDGGLAEYSVVPAKCLFKLPDHVSLEEGSLVENSANAVAAVRLARIETGQRVVVIGGTPIGLLAMQVARLESPRTLVLAGTGHKRLALAERLGASHTVEVSENGYAERLHDLLDGRGADAVIVCGYSREDLDLAMEVVGSLGRIVVEGHFDPTVEVTLSPQQLLISRAVTMTANRGWTTPDFTRALELISNGMLDAKSVITHTFPLDAWEEAFETFASPDGRAVHAAIDPQG